MTKSHSEKPGRGNAGVGGGGGSYDWDIRAQLPLEDSPQPIAPLEVSAAVCVLGVGVELATSSPWGARAGT